METVNWDTVEKGVGYDIVSPFIDLNDEQFAKYINADEDTIKSIFRDQVEDYGLGFNYTISDLNDPARREEIRQDILSKIDALPLPEGEGPGVPGDGWDLESEQEFEIEFARHHDRGSQDSLVGRLISLCFQILTPFGRW